MDGAFPAAPASAMMAAFPDRQIPETAAMAMTARELVERLNLIKASVDSGEAGDLAERLHGVKQRLKSAYAPEQLKAALASDEPIPTPLEEEVTTLTMEWMSRRGAG